jgi:hypothetical protein
MLIQGVGVSTKTSDLLGRAHQRLFLLLISQCAFKGVQVVTDRHRLLRMLGTDTLIGCDGSYCSKVGLGVNADFLESTRNGRTDVPKLFDRQVW